MSININAQIHSIRGAAALAVALAHFRTIPELSNSNIDFMSMFAYGVDVFFVISGFAISTMIDKNGLSGRSVLTSVWFFISRSLRVLPVMWAAMALYWMSVGVTPGADNLIYSFFLIPSENDLYGGLDVFYLEPQWSLGYEMIFYLISSLFLVSLTPIYYLVIVLGFGVLLNSFLSIGFYCSYLYIEFLIGVFVYTLLRDWKGVSFFRKKYMFSIFLILFLISAFVLREKAGDISSYYRAIIVGPIAGCFLLVVAQLSFSKCNGICRMINRLNLYISDMSFSIYLTHMLVLREIAEYIDDYHIIFQLIIYLFVVILVSLVFYISVEKHAHSLSRYIFKRRVLSDNR